MNYDDDLSPIAMSYDDDLSPIALPYPRPFKPPSFYARRLLQRFH